MRPVDYPRASLARCLELAAAIHELGGECDLPAAAEKLGASPGGAFSAVVSAAGRFGLVTLRRGRLRTEPAFREYRLAYDAAERERTLAQLLANVPLFRRLLDRFGGHPVPEGRLDRVLAREFGVPEGAAERVAGYFLDAARSAGLLAGGLLRGTPARAAATSRGDATLPADRVRADTGPTHELASGFARPNARPSSGDTFRVHVTGPGLDSTVEIATPEDLDLLRATFARLERALVDRR